jgi:hypothetical protein
MSETKKVRYIGPYDEVEIAPADYPGVWRVQNGHQIELPIEVARGLLQQVDHWERVPEKKAGD